MPRKKSKKLKILEEKLKLVKKELSRRKKSSPSPSKTKRSRKSKLTVFEECRTLLEKVKKMQYSKAFLTPVDWKNLNIPTYPQIIKHPMDLATVQKKLNNDEYNTPYDFARDMRLIYQNATTFNKPTTPYYIAATKFGKKFEEEFERKIIDGHETNEFTKKICKVIVTLIKRDDSIPFRAPVNPQVLEIPDYHDVIDNPMDLGTILNKICYYRKFKEFAHDLFLVWNNCCRYNPKQNQIHQTALKLKEYSQKQLNRYCQSDFQLWEENESDGQVYDKSELKMNNNMELPMKSIRNEVNNLESQSKMVNEVVESPVTTTSHSNVPIGHLQQEESIEEEQETNKEPDIFKLCDDMEDEEEAGKIMIKYLFDKQELDPKYINCLDFQQKEELQRGIQCLDSDHFDPLINMLQSLIPDGEGEDDEVELDVDSIDDELQVKMYNYMLRAITQQENERIKREGGSIVNSMPMVNTMSVNVNSNPVEQQQQQEDNDIKMMDNGTHGQDIMQEQEEQQVNEMEEDVNDKNDVMVGDSNSEQVVNVVHAFPTGDDSMRIDDNNVNNNEENENNKQGMDEEDNDIDMNDINDRNNSNVMDMSGDIVEDITNVIEAGNDGNVIENNNEQKQPIDNDNDVTDTEINDASMQEQEHGQEQQQMEEVQQEVTQSSEQKENVNENVTNEIDKIEGDIDINNANIPTMPVLQEDSNEQMNEEVKNDGLQLHIEKDSSENNNNNLGNEEIINGGLNVNESDDINVNDDSLDKGSENNEEEEVETLLADEIEF